jgi:hypothetical protein
MRFCNSTAQATAFTALGSGVGRGVCECPLWVISGHILAAEGYLLTSRKAAEVVVIATWLAPALPFFLALAVPFTGK